MTYLAGGVEQRLADAFKDTPVLFKVKSDCVVLKNSQNYTKRQIQGIVQSVGFCPLVAKSRIANNIAFTVVPYRLPNFFNEENHCQISNHEKVPYFTYDEIACTLKPFVCNKKIEKVIEDRWFGINQFRSLFSLSLRNGLSKIVSRFAKNGAPIVEIGSGMGYALDENLASQMIRTQPNDEECQLLSQSISTPVYKIDIQGIYNSLVRKEKKVSLFFALNVFDTLPTALRKASFLQISQLQNTGDRILILLDTNPYFSRAIEHLEILYPDHAIYPYFPPTEEAVKFLAIIIPLKDIERKPSKIEAQQIVYEAFLANRVGITPKIQLELYSMQKESNFEVIDIERFFRQQVKNELRQVGYKTSIYYHTSFTTVITPTEYLASKEDLIYKPVSDPMTVRKWFSTDKKLTETLLKKGLNLPLHFDENFFRANRERGEKVFGAEILVIEGIKT